MGINNEAQIRYGRRLVQEADWRYTYWLLTDVVFPDERTFQKKCERFDRRARETRTLTLREIRSIDDIPM